MRSAHTHRTVAALLLLLAPLLLTHVHAVLNQQSPNDHRLDLLPRGSSPSGSGGGSKSRTPSPSKGPSSSSPKHVNLDLTLGRPGTSSHHPGSQAHTHTSAATHTTAPPPAVEPKKKYARPAHYTETDSELNKKWGLKRQWWNQAGATGADIGRSRKSKAEKQATARHQAQTDHQHDAATHLKWAPKRKWWNEKGATGPTMGRGTWRSKTQGKEHGHDVSEHPSGHDKHGGGGGRPGSPGGAAGTHAVM